MKKPNNEIINCRDNLKSQIEKVHRSKKPANTAVNNLQKLQPFKCTLIFPIWKWNHSPVNSVKNSFKKHKMTEHVLTLHGDLISHKSLQKSFIIVMVDHIKPQSPNYFSRSFICNIYTKVPLFWTDIWHQFMKRRSPSNMIFVKLALHKSPIRTDIWHQLMKRRSMWYLWF